MILAESFATTRSCAMGIPQYAAIMGNCVAGGAYLPVLSDKLLMTEGSGLYLAGPALVKAAIGQVVEAEELGVPRCTAKFPVPSTSANLTTRRVSLGCERFARCCLKISIRPIPRPRPVVQLTKSIRWFVPMAAASLMSVNSSSAWLMPTR